MLEKRAQTPEQKREVIDRLYDAWLRSPDLRLGQLVSLITPNGGDPFYIEDFTLVEKIEAARPKNKRAASASVPPPPPKP